MWLPFHVGMKGNDMADEAASKNLLNNTMDNMPSNDILTSVRSKTLVSVPPTNKLKSIKSSVKLWFIKILLSPVYELVTHYFLISKYHSPICSTCQTRTTIKHIFDECPLHFYEPTRTFLNFSRNIIEIVNEEHFSKIVKSAI